MKSAALRGVVPVLSLIAAIVTDGLYGTLRFGNSLGDSGALRSWIALFIPLLLIAVVAVYALASERGAIHKELDSELATGAVGAEDLRAPEERDEAAARLHEGVLQLQARASSSV